MTKLENLKLLVEHLREHKFQMGPFKVTDNALDQEYRTLTIIATKIPIENIRAFMDGLEKVIVESNLVNYEYQICAAVFQNDLCLVEFEEEIPWDPSVVINANV